MSGPVDVTGWIAQLSSVLTEIRARFTGPARILEQGYVSVDLANPGQALSWSEQAEVATDLDRDEVQERLSGVAAEFSAAGWRAVDRATEFEAALQLSRDGFNVAVSSSSDGSRVVVSGSTPPFPADQAAS